MASMSVKYATPAVIFGMLVVLYLYTIADKNVTIMPNFETIPLSKEQLSAFNHSRFFVDQYQLTDDHIRFQGHYVKAHMENVTDTIRIEGISNLLNQLKPLVMKDDKFEKTELKHEHFFKADRKVKEVSCVEIFKNNVSEIQRAINLTQTYNKTYMEPADYIEMTKNCSHFIQTRGYITDPLTELEKDFPIAYSLLMFKHVEQSERLLRAIYRPQNFYCIHVDNKSSEDIHTAMKSISSCFDNVFVASKMYDVRWGTMTVLEPEIQCMEELRNKSQSWKYFINLTGQEFPLRTNYELVRILQAYNGANDIEGTVKRANKDRWAKAGEAPHNITPVKGAVHIIASKGFVDYILDDQRAKDLLNWTRRTQVPDETFFATLNHNPHLQVPGAYKGDPDIGTETSIKPFVGRFKNWQYSKYNNWPCYGKRVRLICVFGTGDLTLLGTRREMFANKMYLDYHPFVLDCLEELHFNHTRDEYLGNLRFDERWYSSLDFVTNHV